MVTESTGVLILSPREVGTGSPAGASLENIITNPIANGALCYVASGVAQGEWQLDKSSTAAPDGILVIAPIAGPGRWLKMNGGGGGGGVTGVTGAGSITTTNPTGPVVTVDGTALLPRDGTRAMTGNLAMGGNQINGAAAVTSPAGGTLGISGATGVTVTTTTGTATLSSPASNVVISGLGIQLNAGAPLFWPNADGTAGQVLTTNGAGTLSFTSVVTGVSGSGGISITNPSGPTVTVGGAALLARNGSNGGMTADLDMGGNDIQNAISVSSAAGLALTGATGVTVTATTGNASLSATTGNVVIGAATGNILISTATANIDVLSAGGLRLQGGGTNADLWPATNGTVGQVLTIQSAGSPNVLAWTSPVTGVPVPTIQYITAAGPTAVTNTMNTHARVNFAGAAAVTLPAGAVGKQITVKDVSGNAATNNITVSPAAGTIDGGASYIIATNRGSATFVCVSTGPDVWDVV